jgi:hypothetical protein
MSDFHRSHEDPYVPVESRTCDLDGGVIHHHAENRLGPHDPTTVPSSHRNSTVSRCFLQPTQYVAP